MVHLFETAFPFPFSFPALVYAVINKYPSPLAPHVISIDVLDRTILQDGTIRSERLLGVKQDSPKWVNRLLGSQDVTFVREVSFLVPSATQIPSADRSQPYHAEPPKLLMASTNLTLAYIMQCREAISYLPHPWPHAPSAPSLAPLASTVKLPPPPTMTHDSRHPLSHPSFPPHTLFSQSALIFTTGMFASEPYPPIGISVDSPIEPFTYPKAATGMQRAAGRKVERWGTDRFECNAETGRSAMLDAAERAWKTTGASRKK